MPIKGMAPGKVVETEMHKFKHGTLHSGSKHGPKVKSRKQAIAIALSESGQSKKNYDRGSHNEGNPGFPSTVSHSPPHHKESAVKNKETEKAHEAREKQVMGAGYEEHERGEAGRGHDTPQSMTHPKGFDHKQLKGCFLAEHHKAVDVSRTPDRFRGTQSSGPVLRVSGHKGAHQIGKR